MPAVLGEDVLKQFRVAGLDHVGGRLVSQRNILSCLIFVGFLGTGAGCRLDSNILGFASCFRGVGAWARCHRSGGGEDLIPASSGDSPRPFVILLAGIALFFFFFLFF